MSCEIVLSNHTGHYAPGDNVEGTLAYAFETATEIESITLYLKGEESTQWSVNERLEYAAYSDTYSNGLFSGFKTFFTSKSLLAQNRSFEPGIFEIPFSESLPLNLPGSYSGPSGSVNFHIEVITIATQLQNIHKKQKTIHVISPVDIRGYPVEDWAPGEYMDERDTASDNCCGIEGPTTMKVQLDKKVYLIGETILLHIYVNNKSSDPIYQIEAHLIKVIQTAATNPTRKFKSITERIAHNNCPGVEPYKEKYFAVPLKISETLMVYNFNMCRLFDQVFVVRIEAFITSRDNNKMLVEVPVSIGNLDGGPLDSDNSTSIGFAVPGGGVYPPPLETSHVPIPTAPLIDIEGSSETPAYTPPPSYNEAMKNSPSYT